MAQSLKDILKIIAEESVRNAYQKEKEYQSKISSEYHLEEDDEDDAGDDPLFDEPEQGKEKGGDEEGGEPSPDDAGEEDAGGEEDIDFDLDVDTDDTEDSAKQQDSDDAEQVHWDDSPVDLELGKVEIEGVATLLNMIRAGQSLKDADVAEQLRSYFESLSDAEKLALATFLSGIKDIVGGSPASDSLEPSDPEVDLQITSVDGPRLRPDTEPNKPGDPQQQTQPQSQPQSQQQAVQTPQAQQQPTIARRGEENTEPPIVVGRKNEAAERAFRARVRAILENSSK